MRRASNIDLNHVQIVQVLRQAGATVASLAAVGKGVPDLLVGYQGRNFLMEVKRLRGKLNPTAKLTADQEKFFREWNGRVYVVTSPEQALEILGEAA